MERSGSSHLHTMCVLRKRKVSRANVCQVLHRSPTLVSADVCGDLPTVTGAQVVNTPTAGIVDGTVVTYECVAGLEPSSTPSVTCRQTDPLSSGVWTAVTFACQRNSFLCASLLTRLPSDDTF